MEKRIKHFLILAAAAVALWYFLPQLGDAPAGIDDVPFAPLKPVPGSRSLPIEVIDAVVRDESIEKTLPAAFYQSLPASLAGAGRPAPPALLASGELVVDMRLRRLFEHYLTALGEEPLEHIVARIRNDLRQQLPTAAYEEAIGLLEGYLQYRNEVGNIRSRYSAQATDGSHIDLNHILDMKRAIAEARSDFMPAEAVAAFFAEDDAYDQFMVSRAAILNDKTLADAEKSAQLASLTAATDPGVLAARRQSQRVANLQLQERKLRAEGAGPDAIFALREQSVGSAAATRLAELDQQRQAWNERVATYRRELKTLEADTQYPEDERRRLIAVLRSQHFSSNEALRIRALDNLRDHHQRADTSLPQPSAATKSSL